MARRAVRWQRPRRQTTPARSRGAARPCRTGRPPPSSGVEVLRLGGMHDDRVGGLLGHQLEALGQRDTDAVRLEQLDDLGAILEVGTGWITEGVARPAIGLVRK